MITIFTDGASRGNPGPGGWGSVVVSGDQVRELGAAESHTTNNRMEISAAIGGLGATGEGDEVRVYTDSSYVINGITKWIKGWKKNGWVTKTKQEVLNRDLWEKLDELAAARVVKWEYVGGHVGVRGNERCDFIATDFADGNDPKLFDGALRDYELKDILNISHDAGLAATKKSSSSRSNAKAFSYVSRVGDVIETHKTWAECEKRVKGARGARFKKALSHDDEVAIKKELSMRQSS